MKIIIAGERNLPVTYEWIDRAIRASGFDVTEVVSGRGGNVDLMGEEWAERNDKPVTFFPADWGNLGRSAGPIRNSKMAEYGEGLILLWTGKGTGSTDIRKKCLRRGLPIYEG